MKFEIKQIQDGGSLTVRTFKERFLRFQLLFPDFYHFHHVIWGMKWAKKLKTKNGQNQEPITRSLHLYCTLESTLSSEELFLEQAFPRKSIVSEDVNVNEHD